MSVQTIAYSGASGVRSSPALSGDQAIEATITTLLAHQPPCAHALVLQVVEDASRVAGGRVRLSVLTAMLTPFGVSERLMRTSVFRLVQRGVLYSVRAGRHSECGIARERPKARPDDSPAASATRTEWTLVMGWSGLNPGVVAAVRKQLRCDGFRQLVPGVFARPGYAPADLANDLHRLGPGHRLWVCQATQLPATGQRTLHELAAGAWNLEQIGAGYQRWFDRYAGLPARLRAAAPLAPSQAFMLHALMLCDWRRAQKHDPQLAPALLPPNWPRASCAALYREIDALTAEAANCHLGKKILPAP